MAASHQNRIHASVSAFQTAAEAFIASIERLTDDAATRAPQDGGWSAAQIGYHVATTNDFLANLLTGAVPKAVPAPAGFQENPKVFSAVPARVETFPALIPPADTSRADAIAKLRASVPQTVKAIESLTEDRAAKHVVEFPFGAISLYQLAEFIVGHVVRHQGQLQRATAGV